MDRAGTDARETLGRVAALVRGALALIDGGAPVHARAVLVDVVTLLAATSGADADVVSLAAERARRG
ncbi:MAG: hypothetical protein ACHREM_29570, partial [Polyangiales bacterium]